MTDGSTTNRDALSRALGAAFLNHQVQQLEKSVIGNGYGRERVVSPTKELARGGGRGGRRGGHGAGNGARTRNTRGSVDAHANAESEKSDGDEKEKEDKTGSQKDADVFVVDASLLVHALGQLKAWCRKDRKEVVIVPLEALNTLDMLKKGNSPLAQRARAASRILEQQVGTNDRIKVQRDDAFVPWDNIMFKIEEEPSAIEVKGPHQAPEWLRRTICCAKWEVDQAATKDQEETKDNEADVGAEAVANDAPTASNTDTKPTSPPASTVAVAVCTTSFDSQESTPVAAASPVPLPSPAPQQTRCAGTLVQLWAEKAGIPVLDFKPTFPPGSNQNQSATGANSGNRPRTGSYSKHGHNRVSSDEDYMGNGASKGNSNNARRGSYSITGINSRPPQHENISATEKHASASGIVYGPSRGRGHHHHHHRHHHGGGTLVERPAATMAMNASMMQPSKVIRVLARGEKLDP